MMIEISMNLIDFNAISGSQSKSFQSFQQEESDGQFTAEYRLWYFMI